MRKRYKKTKVQIESMLNGLRWRDRVEEQELYESKKMVRTERRKEKKDSN